MEHWSLTMAASAVTAAAADYSEYTIAMLPKFKGENYFDAVKTGAEEAAEELGITLLYDGLPRIRQQTRAGRYSAGLDRAGRGCDSGIPQ